jgi:hypothetical protein
MVVIVPPATFDVDVDVAVDVDVVDAAAADIVGTGIRLAVVDLRTLPAATTAGGASTAATPTGACGASTATTAAASRGGISVGGYGETGENKSGH